MSPRTCPHGFPKPANCWDCMEEGNLDPLPQTAVTVLASCIVAEFDGHCNGCNLEIHNGQLISRMSNGSYRHDHCADDQ